MESLVSQPLSSLETHLNSLITSLTQTNTFTSAPSIAKDLISADDALSSSLTLLQRHQQNYARILNLRAEVATLQAQLKDTIRRCVALREEIGAIHPSILTESDSDDEEGDGETKVAEVDYHTLLTFAARIGKHNAVAAREAEAESVRRKIAAKNDTTTSTAAINGIAADTSAQDAEDATQNATAESQSELLRINNTIALNRAQMGMAFPDASILRMGALGQLQLFAERQAHLGSDDDGVQAAVDREVEKMVRETEDVAEELGEGDEKAGWVSPELTRRSTAGELGGSQANEAGIGPALQPTQSQQQQKPPKKKVDLGFPSSDDEDD